MMNKYFLLAILFLSISGRATTAPEEFSFSFKTTKGKMHFECPRGWSPIGAQRLHELITTGFFTDVGIFRVITGFVAQFGISGDPVIAAKWKDAMIGDDPVVASNVAGTLAYATDGPNTRTTQLYINLVDNIRLDSKGFSPVCKIVDAESLTVAKEFYAGYGESPNQDLITEQGNPYLKTNFPLLDYILSAQLEITY